jgi:hypothetical protein
MRELVIYLGGDVRNQKNGSWQSMQQDLNMNLRPDCLLLRRGEPGTDEHSMFYFNEDNYHRLMQRPSHEIAVQHLRHTVPDQLLRTYVISVLGGAYSNEPN